MRWRGWWTGRICHIDICYFHLHQVLRLSSPSCTFCSYCTTYSSCGSYEPGFSVRFYVSGLCLHTPKCVRVWSLCFSPDRFQVNPVSVTCSCIGAGAADSLLPVLDVSLHRHTLFIQTNLSLTSSAKASKWVLRFVLLRWSRAKSKTCRTAGKPKDERCK